MMATWLEEHGVELVVLAGYMHLLTKPFLDRFPGRIVNVHPSLLPAFPGAHAIEDALAAGVETTGVTVHLVDEGVDTGPILARRPCRSSRARRSRSASTRSSTACCPRSSRCSLRTRRRDEGADLGLGQARHRRRSRAALAELGFELVSSGGTAAFLEEQGLEVTRVEEVTAAPEMLGGRVKTLHPRDPRRHPRPARPRGGPRHARRARDRAVRPRLRQPLPVRLGRRPAAASSEAESIEMIDVGGPSMLRGAAKNFAHVAPVCRPEQYDPVLDELARRRALARDAPHARGRGVRGRRPRTTRRSRAGSPSERTSPSS